MSCFGWHILCFTREMNTVDYTNLINWLLENVPDDDWDSADDENVGIYVKDAEIAAVIKLKFGLK